MKLEVGMYVRTICGIARIKSFEAEGFLINIDKEIMLINIDNYRSSCSKGQILKASHNIIDLIEVGDYVNGSKVSIAFPVSQ